MWVVPMKYLLNLVCQCQKAFLYSFTFVFFCLFVFFFTVDSCLVMFARLDDRRMKKQIKHVMPIHGAGPMLTSADNQVFKQESIATAKNSVWYECIYKKKVSFLTFLELYKGVENLSSLF